jgi:hypothetical protein
MRLPQCLNRHSTTRKPIIRVGFESAIRVLLLRLPGQHHAMHMQLKVNVTVVLLQGKRKVIPLHAMEALGVRGGIYSSYSFLTSALDGGEWSASRPGCALPLGKGPPVPIVQEAGWASEPVWTQRLQEKSSASVGDRTLVVQFVVSHYTAWATSAPFIARTALLMWEDVQRLRS